MKLESPRRRDPAGSWPTPCPLGPCRVHPLGRWPGSWGAQTCPFPHRPALLSGRAPDRGPSLEAGHGQAFPLGLYAFLTWPRGGGAGSLRWPAAPSAGSWTPRAQPWVHTSQTPVALLVSVTRTGPGVWPLGSEAEQARMSEDRRPPRTPCGPKAECQLPLPPTPGSPRGKPAPWEWGALLLSLGRG